MKPALLNVGCGTMLHPDWVNVDVAPSRRDVRRCDLTEGLPFPDRSFDACYCSHVLEHLEPAQAERAVAEIYRVLRPGGVVRVVVPDLAAIAEHYLDVLAALDRGERQREADYDWIMLELYDQAVRSVPGGRMRAMLSRPDLPNRDFIRARIGEEAQRVWQAPAGRGILGHARQHGWLSLLRVAFRRLAVRQAIAQSLVRLIAGRSAAAALREGLHRRTGEVHRWMYDRFSLGRLLSAAGFVEIVVLGAGQSAIPDFSRYGLDVNERGEVRKPDSTFVEGRRRD